VIGVVPYAYQAEIANHASTADVALREVC